MGVSGRRVCVLAFLVLGTAVSVRAGDPAKPAPVDPGLSEHAESRLVQFEVRVTKHGTGVPGLGASDLDIELGGKTLRRFTVDDMCLDRGRAAARPGSFIFYFDDPELTQEGRLRAVEIARLVAPMLIAGGHDVMVLQNGKVLRKQAGWSRDPAAIAAALDRIAADAGRSDYLQVAADGRGTENLIDDAHQTVFAGERARESYMEDALEHEYNDARPAPDATALSCPAALEQSRKSPSPNGGARQDMLLARTMNQMGDQEIFGLIHHLDNTVQSELQRTGRDLDRLRGAVRALTLRESPKGIVYFADMLRNDPGGSMQRQLEQIHDFTDRNMDDRGPSVGRRDLASTSTWTSDVAIRSVVNEAALSGARFYAVEGRGLMATTDWIRTAQDTMVGLAAETGGASFVNGPAASVVANGIQADQACWYLVSFDPKGWDTDRPMSLEVFPKKPGLRVSTRSSLVIPSAARLNETRLLAAYFGDSGSSRSLDVSVYPVGGTADRLNALVQVVLPEPGPASDASWNVGISVVSKGAVVAQRSGRIAAAKGGPAPVYQSSLSIPAGPYEVVAVAQDAAGDSIASGRLPGAWPAATGAHIGLSKPVLAQPRTGGIVVRGAGETIDPRVPTAFVTAACLDASGAGALRAERSIAGETTVSFSPMDLSADEGRCVQIRDLVAPGSFGAGRLTYTVHILSGDAEVATEEMKFDVADVTSLASLSN